MCVYVCVYKMCAQLCLEPETRAGAGSFLHLVVQECRQMLQPPGSKQPKNGGVPEV